MIDETTVLIGVGLLVGFVKTGLPAGGIFVPVLMALAFPARASVAILLPYLIVGDVIAVCLYRKKANLREVKRVFPWIFVGILMGVCILGIVNEQLFKTLFGGLILALIAFDSTRSALRNTTFPTWAKRSLGVSAGVATALANAAGPLMAVYLLIMKLDKHAFMGTTAVLFCIVNISKVPFYASLGLFQLQYVLLWLVSIPAILIGAFLGKLFVDKISQRTFSLLIRILTVVAGAILIGLI